MVLVLLAHNILRVCCGLRACATLPFQAVGLPLRTIDATALDHYHLFCGSHMRGWFSAAISAFAALLQTVRGRANGFATCAARQTFVYIIIMPATLPFGTDLY